MATLEESQAILRQLSPTEEKVGLAIQAAIEMAHPSRIFLFGSWPRGEAQWDSDLDLAVILPDSAAPISSIRRELRRKLESIPMTIDLLFATESQVAAHAGSINSIFYQILTRGRLVYASKSAS